MNKSVFLYVSIGLFISECAQPLSHKLNIDVKDNKLCIYTNNKNTYLSNDNYFTIFVGEYNPNEKFKSLYNKVYTNTKFPIEKNDCLTIPSYVFKKDKIYRINIETNKNLSVLVCVSKKKSILSFKIMKPEDSSCSN
ncbi:NF045616 family extracytoplasmic (lipo)protein [Acinetobacter rongchengensis]|uniref:Glycosyltransferase n=1 Tax=Acinetobacter rongchengensis TaxID=2419601 RepID=A0A3A8E7H8_9GAMM|nr:NF045616 family extracytoplasmic (lipo)protein [Acinetobacter rongchengensis]RKG29536.1 glycosyltransferase [Acinetobacter rongchengensis]